MIFKFFLYMTEMLYAYAGRFSTPEPDLLVRLSRETHLKQVYPQMLSGHLQGNLLRMICRMMRPSRILEIGTFTGYSAIAMGYGAGSAAEDGYSKEADDWRLHTIEVNPELEEGIMRYLRESGMERNIVLHTGDAMQIIPQLEERWDLVFIDADKPNYLNYYQAVFPRVRRGGLILADNVLWDGKVLGDRSKMDRDTLAITQFNEFVKDDQRVETLLLPLRDGLMMIWKK